MTTSRWRLGSAAHSERSGPDRLDRWSWKFGIAGVLGGVVALWVPTPYHHVPSLAAVFALLALVFSAAAFGLGMASVARERAHLLPALVGVAFGMSAIGLVVLAIVTKNQSYPV